MILPIVLLLGQVLNCPTGGTAPPSCGDYLNGNNHQTPRRLAQPARPVLTDDAKEQLKRMQEEQKALDDKFRKFVEDQEAAHPGYHLIDGVFWKVTESGH